MSVLVSAGGSASPDESAAEVDAALAPILAVVAKAGQVAAQRVSASQMQALDVISRHESLNLTGLAEALGMLPSSATRLCHRLVAAGLIQRSSGITDRREVVVSLTSSGVRLLREVREVRQGLLRDALSPLNERDRIRLVKGLNALAASLGRTAPGEAEPARSLCPPTSTS